MLWILSPREDIMKKYSIDMNFSMTNRFFDATTIADKILRTRVD
jgi:hypothetical protein